MTAGPACSAAALPVLTKMPAPMMQPMPRRIRLIGPSVFFSSLVPYSAWICSIVMTWPAVSLSGANKSPVVCVEGPMDALAASGEGCLAIAFMGVTPPPEVISFAVQLIGPSRALLVMDADQPKAMVALLEEFSAAKVRSALVTPYPFKDLAEADRRSRRAILAGYGVSS